MLGRAVPFLLALLLAACGPKPVPATPALWEVTGPDGSKGWLFGTVHALERPADWRSARIDTALGRSGVILVEVAGIEDKAAIGKVFARLATSDGHPPLSARVSPSLRGELLAVLKKDGLRDSQFGHTETWAAALMIARAETADLDSDYGIDQAVMKAAASKPVAELEGAAAQFALFDSLPEKEQRDLLDAVIADAGSLDGESADLARAWRRGDMATIAHETEKGLLADPELREALFTGRNRRWSEKIARDIVRARRPFVAVGAAHMAGSEGLPAMLEAEGFKVRRVQ